ncbi:MAG: arsenite methyltransferase [Leptospiraceae bacterium]|nr:arsenite methyltransferase [Leptospiraceae bacterium]
MNQGIEHNESVRGHIRENYGKVAEHSSGCGSGGGCCTPGIPAHDSSQISTALGYSADELGAVPQGANLGLGCGNPQAIADLQTGEHVLDLGSGAGFDAFLAAKAVGLNGRVIGVDMTPEMISKSRLHAASGDFDNTDFRLGEIENLPVADGSIDVIISNCVINLALDKERVFQESYRVLKSGGRLAISDIVATAVLPDEIKNDLNLISGCVAGASAVAELEQAMQSAGFLDIQIRPKNESREFLQNWVPGSNVADYIVAAVIEARKA